MNCKVEVRTKGSEKGVFAKEAIQKGEVIIAMEGVVVHTPSRYSLQLDAATHLEIPANEKDPEIKYPWKFLNHGCYPNAWMDVQQRKLIAIKNIAPGEEINFNYNTTEYALSAPFECSCAGKNVVVRGYKYLSDEEKQRLKPYVAAHLLE